MVRVIMTQTENTKRMCEFQTRSIPVSTVLSIGQYLWGGEWFQALHRLHGIRLPVFLH